TLLAAHCLTLSLHDALPISEDRSDTGFGHRVPIPRIDLLAPLYRRGTLLFIQRMPVLLPRLQENEVPALGGQVHPGVCHRRIPVDRKSTRLNSSHVKISYAV